MPHEPLPSPEIWHGGDFPLLCQWRRLERVVEIGVDRGEFAASFLHRNWNCSLYLGIDPYLPYHEMPWDRSADFQAACIRFERHALVAKLARASSADVAMHIRDVRETGASLLYGSEFDFIYLDGSHRAEDVLDDLNLWWPLLSDKGIIAGHDWSMKSGDHPGVQQAVTEFANLHDAQVYFTTNDDPQCWYFYKSGMPGPDWSRC